MQIIRSRRGLPRYFTHDGTIASLRYLVGVELAGKRARTRLVFTYETDATIRVLFRSEADAREAYLAIVDALGGDAAQERVAFALDEIETASETDPTTSASWWR